MLPGQRLEFLDHCGVIPKSQVGLDTQFESEKSGLFETYHFVGEGGLPSQVTEGGPMPEAQCLLEQGHPFARRSVEELAGFADQILEAERIERCSLHPQDVTITITFDLPSQRLAKCGDIGVQSLPGGFGRDTRPNGVDERVLGDDRVGA